MQRRMQITGMTCAACSARVEKAARSVEGVTNVQVNLLAGALVFSAEDSSKDLLVTNAIIKAGYGVKNDTVPEDKAVKKSKEKSLVPLIVSFAFLAIHMYFTMGKMLGIPQPSWYVGDQNVLVAGLLQFLLMLPVVYLNRGYYIRGLKAIIHGGPNMDTLIAVGSGAAIIHGIIVLFRVANLLGSGDIGEAVSVGKHLYFESAAMILTLVSLGKTLESRAKGKAGDAIAKLMQLRPKTASCIRDGEEVTVSLDEVRVGDVLVLRSGEYVAVDGVIIEGAASIDQSAITGESLPVEKAVGDSLAAATVCTQGYLKYKAVKVGQDTTLAQIIRMVEEAGGSKAPIARLADKVASVFVPIVMAVAVLTLAVWLLIGYDFAFALNMAISVLVISCPCALGLATPVAIMVATGRGAAMGILFRNARSLETLHKVNTVVMDKTGTLTVGKPQIVHVEAGDVEEAFLLQVAGSLEQFSEHLYAKAVKEYTQSLSYFNVSDFTALPGYGISGEIGGTTYYGGNRGLMESIGICPPNTDRFADEGKTPLFFAADDGTYLGCVVVADVLKEDAADTVGRLRRSGVDVIMLTGDNGKTAAAIASKAGVDHVISDVLPHEKAGVIKQLREEGKIVAMVGDGINDAPALAEADVGIAMGSGTDVAVESAGVVVMGNHLAQIYDAISLSHATIRNIKGNLFWAFFYNMLGIPVAAGVLYPAFGIALSPMIGSAAMSFSSVFVVSNALRLRSFGKSKKTVQKCACEEVLVVKENAPIVLRVEGMMCSHCKARVEQVCMDTPGTQSAQVDLQAKTVNVTGHPDIIELKKAITEAGYEVTE